MILITGATGTVGRPLVDMLVAQGARVRAVVRPDDPKAAELPAEVDVVPGDLAQPESIATALADTTTLFVHPRAVGLAAQPLLALAAEENGVKRVVAQTAINAADDPAHQPSRFNGDHNTEVDAAVNSAGLPWAIVRPSSFAVNTRMWAGQIRAGDVVYGPYPDFTEALIHEQDLAAVLARVILEDHYSGHIPVTGPQPLTHAELVTIIGEVIDKPLRYQEVPPQAAAQAMVQRGLPEPFVQALMGRYARGVGPAEAITDNVEQILGRPAMTYRQWVGDHVTEFQGRRDRSHVAGA